MTLKYISKQRWSFIAFHLEQADENQQKRALQNLSFLLRSGATLEPSHQYLAEQLVLKLIKASQNTKVIRWCLNNLAIIASEAALRTIEDTLYKYEQVPEIVGAAVTALSKVFKGQVDQDVAKSYDIDPIVFMLAALQNTDPKTLDWQQLNIEIVKAHPEVLKLALILVGTGKAIPNLFHPRFTNEDLISQLSEHDDPIVRQYSIWGIIENPFLDANNSKIDVMNFEAQPVNVQSKLVQLGAAKISDRFERHDLIERASSSDIPEVREGAAKGIQSVWYDGLDTITLPWLDEEATHVNRQLLAEHISANSRKSGEYYEKSLSLFERDTKLRSSLLLGAESNSTLGNRLRKIESQEHAAPLGLFGDLDAELVSKVKKSAAKHRVKAIFTQNHNSLFLRLDKEYRQLQRLWAIKNLTISAVIAANLNDLSDISLSDNFNILHISGHADTSGIQSEDTLNRPATISVNMLSKTLSEMGGVNCLVLNACESHSIADQLRDKFNYAIACKSQVPDYDAIEFSQKFYGFLDEGAEIDVAFNATLSSIRSKTQSLDSPYSLIIGTRNSRSP